MMVALVVRGAKAPPRGIRFHFISSVSMKYFTANIFMPLVCVLCLALPLWSCVWCLPLPCGLVCGFWLYRCGLVCGVWHYHFSLMCFEDVIVEIRWGCSHCTEQVMQMYYTVICKPLVICTEGDWKGGGNVFLKCEMIPVENCFLSCTLIITI